MARYPGLTLRVLGRRAAALGPGKAELIERIGETGSISAAARAMGMSYRRAWQLVEAMNRDFASPLVSTATGGKRGGGAMVSELGRDALQRFRKMELKASRAIARDTSAFGQLLRQRPRKKT